MPTFKNEADVKKVVKKVLATTDNCWWFMPPANGFGRSGIPDFVGVVNGYAFAVETKFGRNDPTANQLREMANATKAGTKVWIVRETSLDGWTAEFKAWCNLCS